MSENAVDCEALRDEHIDTMLRLALQYREKCEIEKLIAQEDIELNADEEKLAQMTYRHFEQKLAAEKKAEKQKLRRERLKKAAPRVLEIAACLVLALAIAAPVAIANSPAIRVQVMKLLVSFEDGHVNVGMTEDENASFDVPAEWRGHYYPSYIPEGYELVEVYNYSLNLATYSNADNNTLYVEELDPSAGMGIDSANATITYEDINGKAALVISKDYGTSVTWSEGDVIISIDTEEPKEKALEVARSVRRIN